VSKSDLRFVRQSRVLRHKSKTASDCNHFSRSPFSMRAMLSRMEGEGFVAAWGKSNLRNGFNSYDYLSRNISKKFSMSLAREITALRFGVAGLVRRDAKRIAVDERRFACIRDPT